MTRPNRSADAPSRCTVCSVSGTPCSRASRDAVLRLLARHAHRHAFAKRGVGLAALGKMVHLRQEGLTAGKGFRIEDLQEYVAAPALLGVLAAEPGQALGERLDHEREPKPLVAVLEPAQQQETATRLRLLKHARVPRRPPLGVEQPRMLELLAGGGLLARHGDRRDRRADVDQDRCAGPRIADGERVGCEQRLAPAIRGDEAEGWIGGGQDGDATAVRRLLHERRQASDVMAATYREGDHAVSSRPARWRCRALARTSQRPGR